MGTGGGIRNVAEHLTAENVLVFNGDMGQELADEASGAMGALSGVRGEVEARLRDQLERVLAGMDLVSREEFEAVKAMAAKAREEQELLRRRLEALEARLDGSGSAGPGEAGPSTA